MATTLPNIDDPAFLTGDRLEGYRTLRDDSPVLAMGEPGHETWVLSRFADVYGVLRAPSGRMQVEGTSAPEWMREGPTLQRLRANMVQTDRPIHTRLRSVIGPLFTARQSDRLRDAATREVANELDALGDDDFDAVHQLAARVPRGVLRLLIGMPDEDWEPMLRTQLDFLMIFSPFPLPQDMQERLDEVSQFYFDYFDGLLGRTSEPTDLVQRLLDAEEKGDLSRVEVLSLMHTVLDAGFETTRTSISNLVELFATVPGLMEEVRADESLVAGVVEEALRLRAPVQANTRILTEDYEASDGTILPAGARTLAVIGSANTDERTFPDPGTADPHRENASKHLSFGGGLHHCLGAPLARVQLRETVTGLVRRFSRIELVGETGRHPSLIFPSLSRLPVRAYSP